MGSTLACQGNEHHKVINSKLKEAERVEKETHKLLFIGPGGSGKSTIFKQLQWLHGDGFSVEDSLALKDHIYHQITAQMKDAINKYMPPNDNEIDSKLQENINICLNFDTDKVIGIKFDEQISSAIQYVWKNEPRIANLFTQFDKNKTIDESTEYFWNSIDRIKKPDYVPDPLDIINVRYKTNGITEKIFTINSARFHIFDVGGQQSERRKWFYCFDGLHALVFVVSLSCFSETTFEDRNKNAMVDSLETFEQIINNKYFATIPVILFLNKTDLYKVKFQKKPITECEAFRDYGGDPLDYTETTDYIINKFKEKSKVLRQIYPHLTCAMDKKNIENVFNDVTNIVCRQLFKKTGMVSAAAMV